MVSMRKNGRIMKANGLVSNYTIAQLKVYRSACNKPVIENSLARKFDDRAVSEVFASDLTYVRANGKWNYVCILIDLFNREIIGYSAGENKNSLLVHQAFASIKRNLTDIQVFHIDRGNDFKNKLIDDVVETFIIKRSLSKKGCPYDNAVAEATFKIFKTEFGYPNKFRSLNDLKLQLYDYVNWFNNHRMSIPDYIEPCVEPRLCRTRIFTSDPLNTAIFNTCRISDVTP